ncbi:MAG TPA: energy transducer TonB, partial [Longimicrobiaceae bacterium]|nr:energy transducer TonB [Longimicrobiaceae bacterium]
MSPVILRPIRLGAAVLLAFSAAAGGCTRNRGPVTPPRLVTSSPFQYPEELWDAGVEGETTLRIHVGTDGLVDSAKVDRSSRYAAFDSAALAGTRALRFEPARRAGEPVAAWYRLPVQ